jgi:hypothetical protein
LKRLWWGFVALALATIGALYLRDPLPLMEIRGISRTLSLAADSVESVTRDTAIGLPGVYVKLRDGMAGPFGDLTLASEGRMIKIFVCGKLVQEPTIVSALYVPRFILTFADDAAAEGVYQQLNKGRCTP